MCCQLACCLAGGACSCVARAAPAKLVYLSLLFAACFVAFLFRSYGGELVVDLYSFRVGCEGEWKEVCLGMFGVYRLSFACFVFFAVMAVASKASPSAHNGWWLFKAMALFALLVISFLIPNEFFEGYADMARVGSVLFLLLQLLIIIDFAYDLHEFLLLRAGEYDARLEAEGYEAAVLGNCWRVAYVALSFGFLIAAGVGIGLMYGEFPSCGLNTFFISETVLVGVVYVGMSVSAAFGKGLLTPAVVLAHSVYLAYSAIASNPDGDCNPTVHLVDSGSVVFGIVVAALALCWTAFRAAGAGFDLFRSSQDDDDKAGGDVEMQPPPVPPPAPAEGKEGEGGGAAAGDGERPAEASAAAVDPTAWFFHLIMCFAALYMAMMLTNWGSVEEEPLSANPEISETSMWVKIVSQWFGYVIYLWTLMAPMCCPGRDFSDTHNSFA